MVEIYSDMTTNVTAHPPRELMCGATLGYLRAKGFSWSDALVGMGALLDITQPAAATPRPARHGDLKMELITCSVGCGEFLKVCLERNMKHFDRTVVVTDSRDKESLAVAGQMGADVFVTDRFYLNGNRFDRGTAYDRALKVLRHRDWVAFMDVDIVLPRGFRSLVEEHGLSDDCFYGCRRRHITSDEAREAFLSTGTCEWTIPSEYEWGFGYLQMFNMGSRFIQGKDPVYPGAEDCNHSDYLFRKQFGQGHTFDEKTGAWQWDPTFQIRLPFDCYHLGSNGAAPSLVRHYENPHGPPVTRAA